jgi:hypothetical protein
MWKALRSLFLLAALLVGASGDLGARTNSRRRRRGRSEQKAGEGGKEREREDVEFAVSAASIGLLAAGVVVQAGWKAYTIYKERRKWEIMARDMKCVENLADYSKITAMIKFMRVVGLVSAAGGVEKGNADVEDVALVGRLERTCDMMLQQRKESYVEQAAEGGRRGGVEGYPERGGAVT